MLYMTKQFKSEFTAHMALAQAPTQSPLCKVGKHFGKVAPAKKEKKDFLDRLKNAKNMV